MIKARTDGDGCLYMLLIQLCDTIVGIITVYLTMNCCCPYLQSVGLLFHYVPTQEPTCCAHTLCFTGIHWTQWRSQQLVEVLLIYWCSARYNSVCLPVVFRISTCVHLKRYVIMKTYMKLVQCKNLCALEILLLLRIFFFTAIHCSIFMRVDLCWFSL